MRTAEPRGELRHSPLRDLSGHGWAGRRSGIGAGWYQRPDRVRLQALATVDQPVLIPATMRPPLRSANGP